MAFVNECVDWIGWGFVRFLTLIVQHLPLGFALALGRGVGGIGYFLSFRRRVAYANLKAAFPESTVRERRGWIREMFGQLGMAAAEMMRIPVLRIDEVNRHITNHGYEGYLKLLAERKGLILLTAHLGNWEYSQIAEGIRGRPLVVLARRQKHKRLDRFLDSLRQYYGSVTVEKGAGIRDLIRTLRQGGCVGVLGDQSGGDRGVWVRFFGRLTTAPRGPMALALKLGVPVLPVFMRRRRGANHDLYFGPEPLELVPTGDHEKDIQTHTERYIKILESAISQSPGQWLWGHKRWKRTRTKRVVILSDGKPGHVRQSEALAKEIFKLGKGKTPPYEISLGKIAVRFRSPWRKLLFPVFAFFFHPFAQGRLSWLSFFFPKDCSRALEKADPDIVLSSGASLAPLNLILRRENLAKSVVILKPSFPFDGFQYDLALIPAHDRGWMPRRTVRFQGALSSFDEEMLCDAGQKLGSCISRPDQVRMGVFLGGATRNFKLSLSEVEQLMAEIDRLSEALKGDFLVTTSRRTPEDVNQFLSRRFKNHPRCPLCVIASEDSRPEVVPGMMALADYLIVTEDSLSMISEAVCSGKTVVVVKMKSNGLPKKHGRFQEFLKREWQIPVVGVTELFGSVKNGTGRPVRERIEQERTWIREKLEALF